MGAVSVTYLPVSLQSAEAADGHLASPAFFVGGASTNLTEHDELC